METFRTTAKVLTETLKSDYQSIQGLLKLMESKGMAKQVGKEPTKTGKGKPSIIWELPNTLTLTLN